MTAPTKGAAPQIETTAIDCSARHPARQVPPLEHHWPLADDKRVWFELVPVHRLVGTWQGPGTIAGLRRAGVRRS